MFLFICGMDGYNFDEVCEFELGEDVEVVD